MHDSKRFFGQYLHLFNRGNNKDALFKDERNYHQFLDLFKRYMKPISMLYAYCLLPTHFHLLIKVRTYDEVGDICNNNEMFWYQYNTFLGTYTKYTNKIYQRSGYLFNGGFSQKMKLEEESFFKLIIYIHQNPELYGIVSDYKLWPFSSYFAYKRKDRRSIIAKDFFFNDDCYRQIMESSDYFDSHANSMNKASFRVEICRGEKCPK